MITSFRSVLVAATVLTAVACSKPPAPKTPPVPVTVGTATRGDAPYRVTANGIVEPMQAVAVQSQVAGVLTAVKFKEGDEVSVGQVLFEIDPVPYRAALQQAEAVLARDQATYTNAQRDADRYAALAQKDFVTRSQADQAAATAASLKAVLEADRAAVATAQFNLDNATVRAPVAGKTGSLLVRQGNLIRTNASTPLVVINQIHPILVRFAVPEKELIKVQQYMKAGAVKAFAMPSGGDTATINGTLSFVDNGVDTTTGTVTLKARFQNEDNRLWPGQFVPVGLELFVEKDALLVPTIAVQTGQDGTFIYGIDAEKKAQMHPVTVARQVGDKSVITKGLNPGDKIVIDGQSRLAVGSVVEIKSK
jgi:multidrug efflux system membrane fusion protein